MQTCTLPLSLTALCFRKFCLVSDQPGLGLAGWVLTALQGWVEMSQGACPEGHGPRPLSSGPYTKEGCIWPRGSSPLFNQWLASGLLLQGPAWNKCQRSPGSSPWHSKGGHPPHLQAAAPQVTTATLQEGRKRY